jgi:hypothetical protein
MASATAAPAKKGWLSSVGHFFGSILNIAATKAAPVADMATKVFDVMFPQFATAANTADNLIDNIAKEAIVTEGVVQAAGTATGGGEAKLQAVLANVGPAIDQWVASRFPGSTQVSAAAKAGLVSAVVNIANEVTAPIGASTPATA